MIHFKYDVCIITSKECGNNNHWNEHFVISNALPENLEKSSKNSTEKGEISILPLVSHWSWSGIRQILKEIKKMKPDIVLIQYVPNMYNYFGVPVWVIALVLLIKLFGYKLAVEFHEVAIFVSSGIKYLPIAVLQRCIAYTLCLFADVCFTSMTGYSRMLQFWNKNIRVIPVGSNIIVKDPKSSLLRKEISALKNELSEKKYFMLSSFGSSADYRGHNILLNVIKKEKSLKFIFIGEGPQISKRAEELGIKDRVLVTGHLKSDIVYKYLAISDLFICLNVAPKSGIGMKSCALMAAFYAGLPILGYKGIFTETAILKHLENVFLIENCNEIQLHEAIREVMNNDVLKQKLRKGACKLFNEYIAWDRIAEEFIKGFKSINR
ncbi:MAG: hypothetical protein A2Y62_10815 [Candidatus Fischerbacteria bacterium RBG_13_37_8]|uniref:Glycosyl transferase family 1 domain-containing protein n=1 Tax=Candidatus Fischerbacteria bacterium RBG_13_37_8 TaxID=1817863 RepID=A0A1F5VUN7_9BACT|nr:MAG: hypothetical protein A2Y62_10815 [Candidatus Fischerbacteria bacterium RBG_13_37_8]